MLSSIAVLLPHGLSIGSDIRLLDDVAVSVDDAGEPRISVVAEDRFSTGPEIGFLYQISVVIVTAGEFGNAVVPNPSRP